MYGPVESEHLATSMAAAENSASLNWIQKFSYAGDTTKGGIYNL
jgi:hypothetical protein